MTTSLSDPELETLVRAAFADHEQLADPDVARGLATRTLLAAADTPRPGRRRRGALAAAVAAAAVVVGVVVVQQGRDGDGTRPPTPGGTATASATGASDARQRAVAAQAVRDALAHAPTLPGARPATAAEAGPIDPFAGTGDHTVVSTAYSLAPGTVDQAIAHLRATTPPGFTSGGWGSGNGVTAEFVDFEPTDPAVADTDEYAYLSVVLSVVPKGDGVAVRTDAQAQWRPARLAATRLPADAELSTAVVTKTPVTARSGQREARSVPVTPALRRQVAAGIAALRPQIPGLVTPCPEVALRTSAVFTFASGTGPWVVTADPTCQGSVSVSHGGVRSPQVLGSAADLVALVEEETTSPPR